MIKIAHTDYEVIMTETNREISSKKVLFHSEYLIEKIIYYKQLDRIAILFHADYYEKDSQNLICIDTKGNLQWIVPPLESELKHNRMTDIDITKRKYLQVWSFDGIYRLIEVETGIVINQLFVK